ncbi:MAG: SMC-Scp complex subunit ScpB [Oscillospiraceae bacterium]|nr:SMC-Scp complex subunit ScpB [Oscillospiraceae bacterium]
MMDAQMTAGVEAVLFASGDPIPASRLAEIFETDKQTISEILSALQIKYDTTGSGLMLISLPGGWQLMTRQEFAPFVQAALDIKRNIPLSQASMEVLAVVAYNSKPGVTRSFIEQVRGVDSSGVVANLQEKGLLEEAGRLDLPGRPVAYRVTDNFLRCFGMRSLEDLPPLPRQEQEPGADEEQIYVPEMEMTEAPESEAEEN